MLEHLGEADAAARIARAVQDFDGDVAALGTRGDHETTNGEVVNAELTPTKKIWMDGKLVDWENATTHVLSHTLHYGTGAFEGIRAYKTPKGVAVFRLREHMERLLAQLQDPDDRRALHVGRTVRRHHRDGAGERDARRLLHPSPGLPRLRRDGREPDGRAGQRGHRACGRGAPTSATTASRTACA